MAFYDWNKDGKKDIQDDWLEYNIYKKSTEKDDTNSSYNSSPKHYSGNSSESFPGCAWVVIIVIAVLAIISALIEG